MSAKVKIGSVLRELRQKKGVNLSQAAEGAGMTSPALSYYEKDEKDPSLEYAIKLADYYGVTLDELCGRTSTGGDTLAGMFRAYIQLRECLPSVERIQFSEVHWSKSKQAEFMWEDERSDYEHMEDDDPGLRIMFKYAMWPIHHDKLARFMESYEQLTSLVENGQIDRSVLDIWLEKQLSDAANRPR